MSNPWDALKSQLLPLLKASVSDFVDAEKPEVSSFLSEKAEQLAKQTWVSLNGTDEEKAEAISNLRQLKAQVVMEAVDAQILATAAALKLLGKVFDVVVNFTLQYGSKLLLGAAAAA